MINWKHKLDITDAKRAARNRIITPQQFAATVSKKLNAFKGRFSGDDLNELEQIIDDLDCLSDNHKADWDDVDIVMECLYDWGDFDHNCWIEPLGANDADSQGHE